MTSRIPPSRRAPEFAAQRAAKAVQQQTPGAGRVAGASRPAVNDGVQAALRGRVSTAPAPAAAPTTTTDPHDGAGANSTQVGTAAAASAADTLAVGDNSQAAAASATAVGGMAFGNATIVNSSSPYGTAIGSSAYVGSPRSTAIGAGAIVGGFADHTIALGYGASCSVSDRCMIKANDVEVTRSDGTTGATSLILTSPNGSRWRLSVDNSGVLTVAAA